MGDVQVTNPAILTEQAWSIKYLFYRQIVVVLILNGLCCCYLVFYEQAGNQDTDLSHFLAYPSQRPQFNAKRSDGLSFFCSQPHEQLTVKATDEGNHFRFPKPVLLFKTVLKLTDPWLAQLEVRRSAEREVTGSNPGRNNTQGLKITEKKVLPF